MITTSIIANYEVNPLFELNNSGTIRQISRIIQIDATSENIIVTLGTITNNTIKNYPMVLRRIDSSLNTVTIIGTAGNFPEDDPLDLPILSGVTVYASNDLNWRSID